MAKLYSFTCRIALAFVLIVSATKLYAQTAVTIPPFYNTNVGGADNAFPLNSTNNTVQWIFPNGSINTNGATGTAPPSGFINKIYFLLGATTNNTIVFTNFTLKLGQNMGTQNSFTSATWITGLTTVYTNPSFVITGAAAGTWIVVPLQTPFQYNPSQSLIFEMGSTQTAGGNQVRQTSQLNQRIWGPTGGSPANFGAGTLNFGIDVAPPVPNDAAMLSIDSPTVFSAGNRNIWATIKNAGSNRISFINMNWEINGVAQTPTFYNSVIDTPNGSFPNQVQVNLGSLNFLNNTTYKIRAWSYGPNGVSDSIKTNDTTQLYYYRSPLSGNYTIGTGGDFPTITEAFNVLSVAGVSGPVTYTLIDNVYSAAKGEVFPITLRSFQGMSPNNPIVLRPSVSSTPLITDSNSNGLIFFDGVKYLTIEGRKFAGDITRNICFENRSLAGASVIRMFNDVNTVLIRNVVFRSSTLGTGTQSACLYIGGTNKAIPFGNDSIRIINNMFARSASLPFTQGIVFEGQSVLAQNDNITIDSNLFQGFTLNGVLVSANSTGNGGNFIIRNNSFYDTAATASANTTTSINFIPGTTSNSNNNVISDNWIGGNSERISFGGLNRWVFGSTNTGGFVGISITGGTGSGVQVVRNQIRNIQMNNNTASYACTGIQVTGGIATIGGSLANGNIIGHNTDTNNISTYTTAGTLSGMVLNTNNDILVSNNIVQNLSQMSVNTNLLRGISMATGSSNTFNITSNTIRALNATSTSTGTSTSSALFGILSTATSPNIFITKNTIGGAGITDSLSLRPGSLGRMYGIAVGGGVNTIDSNTVYGLYSYSTGTGTITGSTLNGIATLLSTNGQTVTNNTVRNLRQIATTLAATQTNGIMANGASHVINNNTIFDLWTLSNNTGVTTGASLNGIMISTGLAAQQSVTNNTIYNLDNAAPGGLSTQVNGIVVTNTSANTVSGNTIRNIRCNGISSGGSVVGVNIQTSQINQVVDNNLIHSLSSYTTLATPITIGILFTGSNTAAGNQSSVSRNTLHSFFVGASSVNNNNMQAIQIAGNATVANNMIRIGRDSSGTQISRPTFLRPIIINSSTNAQVRVYHNTVVADAQPSAGVGSTTLYTAAIDVLNAISAPGFIDIRNNIFYNTSTNVGTSTINHYTTRFPATITNITSDFNIYFNIPSANTFASQQGTTNYATLLNAKAGMLIEGSSGYGNPVIQNATGDFSTVNLRLQSTNPAEGSGDPATAAFVATDIDGTLRSSNTPTDIGAHAGNFTLISDIIAPSITYNALTNTSSPLSRSFTANIFDRGGIKLFSDTPMVYFRKNLAGTWAATQATLTSGTLQNGVWTFNINTTMVGGLPVSGDTIYYFVVANDSASNFNSNRMYANGTSVSNITTFPTNAQLNWYRITDAMPTTVTVGTGGLYSTLTGTGGFFEAVNNGIIQGNTEVQIMSNITEPGTVQLNQWLEQGVGGYRITIRPQSNTQFVLTGSVANANGLIRLNALNRVSILGWSPSGTNADTNLIIRATSTSTPALGIINGGGQDTFRNVIFESRVSTTTVGVVYMLGSATSGVSTVLFQGCHLRQDLTLPGTLPANAFFATGTAPFFNSNITFLGNFFYNYSANAMLTTVAAGNNWTISGNHYYHNAFSPIATSITTISFQPGSTSNNNTISGNWIGGTAPFAGGTQLVSASQFVGMTISTGFTTGTTIQNNVINNINFNTSGTGFTGIFVTGSPAVYNVTGNRIGSLTGNSITSAGNLRIQGYNSSATGNVTFTFDTITNIVNTSNGATAGITGINVTSGSGNVTQISNNYLRNIILTASTNTGTTTAASLIGIFLTSGSLTQTISNNYLQTLVNTGVAAHSIVGIANTGGVTTINGNTVYGINSASTSATTGASTAPIIGILAGGTTGFQVTTNNIVDSIAYAATTPTSTQIIGIIQNGVSATMTDNIVRNIYTQTSSTSTLVSSAVVGIMYTGASVNNTIERNVVSNFVHANTLNNAISMIGIFYSGSAGLVGNASSISRNFIHSFGSTTTTAASSFTGIFNNAGFATYANNMIRMGVDGLGNITADQRVMRGIFQNTGTQSRYYHNSIYMIGNPTSGVANTSALEINAQVTLAHLVDIRNNILDNFVANAGTATGKNWCLKLIDSLRINSNYNLFYNNTSGGSNGMIGGTQFVDYPGLATSTGWKAIVGLDMASGFGDPMFDATVVAPASAVTMTLQPNNPCERSGDNTLASTVTTDYFGTLRASFTPNDIGAHAGNFNQLPDLFPPVITFTPMLNSGTLTGTRVLSGVSITDNNGIPVSGTNRPRIYYSKDGITWFNTIATGITGTASNATVDFTIDYTPIQPLTTSDTIRYYVIAQDLSGNVISNAPLAVASNVAAVTTHPTSPYRYNFLPIIAANSVFSVGVGQTYTTLTGTGGFFEFINGRTLGGNITAEITSDISNETGATMLNAFAEDGVGGYTLTIRPSSGTSSVRTIQGNPGSTQNSFGSLVILNGASRVKITGVPTGGVSTNKFLRFRNNNTAGAAIEMRNGASANRINNCLIEAGTTPTTMGAISILVLPGSTALCNNDSITNNLIGNNATATLPSGVPSFGIYSNGQPNVFIPNGVITGNEIYNFGNSGMVLDLNNGDGWIISGNSFYNNLPVSISATQFAAINLVPNQNGSGYTITNNFIGGSGPNCSGMWNHSGSTSFSGIRTSTGTGNNVIIRNNTIQNLNFNVPASLQFIGINILGGNTTIGGTPAQGNLIGSTTNASSITFNSFTTNVGIQYSGSNNAIINGNTICGMLMGTAGQSSLFVGINVTTGGVASIDNNTIGSTTLANSIVNLGNSTCTGISTSIPANLVPSYTINGNTISNMFASGTQTSVGIRGITIQNGAVPTVSGNTISNLTTNSTNTTSSNNSAVMGINIVTNTTTIPVITGNTISGLRALNSGTVNTNVTGIMLQQAQTPVMNNNRIFDLTNASTSSSVNPAPTVAGINFGNTTAVNANASNNQIVLGNGSGNNTQFIGIWQQYTSTVLTTNLFNNSVVITGTSSGGNQNSYAFMRGNNTGSEMLTLLNMRNNIFANVRTGGTGKHYAIANQANAPTNTAWNNLSSNYNLFVTANAATMGQWGLNDMNYAGWLANTSSDNFSYAATSTTGASNASQLNLSNLFTNIATGNLGIQSSNAEVWYVFGKGISGSAILGLNSDYAGTTRTTTAGSPVTLGSIQLNANPTVAPIAAAASASPAANTTNTYTFASRTVGSVSWGASAPTSASFLDYTGITPPGTAAVGNNFRRYVKIDVSGGTAPYLYDASLNFDLSNSGSVSSPANLKLSKDVAGTVVSPVWGAQLVSTVNLTNNTVASTSMSSTAGFTSLYLGANENTAPPTITSFVPAAREIGGAVTIRGTLFTGASALSFNGTAQTTYTVVNDTTITTTVPAGATSGPVSVTNAYGTGTSSINFTVISAPGVTSFTPANGTFGTSVTITGTGFTWATQVLFNGVNAPGFTIVNNTTITVSLPNTATTGLVTVVNPAGSASSGSVFTVYGIPSVTSFTPGTGPIGTSVNINGNNFNAITAVRFNGVNATYTVNSTNSITASVPSGATTGAITVVNGSGTGTSGTNFTVTTPPTVNSFSPTAGGVGTSITITGTNFTGATSVTFNGTAATTYSVVNATTITATVPTGATSGLLSVVTPQGTGFSSGTFTVYVDLVVSTTQNISGTYNNVTITGTGNATLSGSLLALGNVTLQTGGTLQCGANTLTGNGNFTMQSGSRLYIGSPQGISATSFLTGNIVANGTKTFPAAAHYFYNGSAAQVTGNGLPASVDTVSIVNILGVSLSQTTTVNTRLNLGVGNLIVGANNLTVSGTIVGASASGYVLTPNTPASGGMLMRNVTNNNTNVLFPIGSTNSYTPVQVALTVGSTPDVIGARVFNGVFSAGTNGGSAITSNVVNRTWVLSEAVNGGSNATVTFQWDDTTEAAGFNRNNCGIAYYRNAQSSWLAPSSYAASSGTNPYTRALAGITQFNTYAVADNTGGVTVPVEMLAFNATAVKNDVILDWATASETNNSHFVIERSADGKSFVSIHTMDGAGNASQVSTYTFTDMNAFAGATTKWYYRLKQVDFDGVNRIAGTVVVSKAAEATEPTLQVFPNPFNSSITLALNGVKSETVQVRIFDMQGKLVGDEQTLTANNAGACHVTMDAYAHLQAGVYFMQVQTGAHTQRVKLVKTDR